MSRHRNTSTGVVVSVDDSKDERYRGGEWEPADAVPKPKRQSKSEK